MTLYTPEYIAAYKNMEEARLAAAVTRYKRYHHGNDPIEKHGFNQWLETVCALMKGISGPCPKTDLEENLAVKIARHQLMMNLSLARIATEPNQALIDSLIDQERLLWPFESERTKANTAAAEAAAA